MSFATTIFDHIGSSTMLILHVYGRLGTFLPAYDVTITGFTLFSQSLAHSRPVSIVCSIAHLKSFPVAVDFANPKSSLFVRSSVHLRSFLLTYDVVNTGASLTLKSHACPRSSFSPCSIVAMSSFPVALDSVHSNISLMLRSPPRTELLVAASDYLEFGTSILVQSNVHSSMILLVSLFAHTGSPLSSRGGIYLRTTLPLFGTSWTSALSVVPEVANMDSALFLKSCTKLEIALSSLGSIDLDTALLLQCSTRVSLALSLSNYVHSGISVSFRSVM